MSSTIQIKFLSLDEMANAKDIDWRYEHVGIDNLGFADKKKNRVFVRAGLEPQLQTLLIDHELSHLFEMEGTDEDEHGIRHKKKGGFMKIFMPILGAILGSVLLPGVGSMLGGGLGTALGGATGVGLGAGLGNVIGSSTVGKPNWLGGVATGATAGLGSAAMSGFGSAAGAAGGGSGIGGGTGSFSEVLGNGLSSGVNAQLANAGSIVGGGATGSSIGSAISNAGMGAGIGNLFTGALGQGQSAQGGYNPTSSGSSFKMPDLSQQMNNNPQFSGWSDTAMMPEMDIGYGQSAAQTSTGVGDLQGLSKMPMNPGLGQAGIDLQGKTGFTNMFQGATQGQEVDPTGYNYSNGGQLSF